MIEVSLADLQSNEADAYRKIKLRVEDVQGRFCLTNFYVSASTERGGGGGGRGEGPSWGTAAADLCTAGVR